MKEHLGFLKVSSAVVKIAAWIFLFLSIINNIVIALGKVEGKGPTDALVNIVISVFLFFFLYIIAKIAELLMLIINEIHELKK